MNIKHAGLLLCTALFMTSCDQASAYAGTWNITTGTSTVTCNGTAETPASLTGTLTFTANSNTTFSETSSNDTSCTLNWTIGSTSNNDATLNSGQTCTSSGNGATVVATFSTGSIVMVDSTHITLSTAAGATVNGATCTQQISISAQKS